MPKVTENTVKLSSSDNFSAYLLSDIACSENVVPNTNFENGSSQRKLNFRVMVERVLRAVISRKPKAHQPNPEQAPQYLLAYVTETLECGHSLDVHFVEAVEPLIAKRRSCPECASRPRKKPVQSVRGLARKKIAGFLTWGSGAVALVTAALLISAVVRRWPKDYFYSYPHNYLRVVENLDPCLDDGSCGYRFVMQAVVEGEVLPETEVHFCAKGIQPRFENGHILAWISYANVGSCLSIDGFDVVRDSARNPILADNCKPDYTFAKDAGHINCEGGRARF